MVDHPKMKCDNCKKHDDCASGGGLVWPCGAYAPKIITNADRIRAKSNEELEDVIVAISLGYEPWCDHHCKMQGEDNCNICLKKWLQQPAEED